MHASFWRVLLQKQINWTRVSGEWKETSFLFHNHIINIKVVYCFSYKATSRLRFK